MKQALHPPSPRPSVPPAIHVPGENCWRVETANFVSILVDYGNYYRNLRESIIKAKHSIFVLGWDIDSRIELLRGKDAENETIPTTFFDLICWKAQQDPNVQIYLNKWNYSIFFMQQRELFWERKWKACRHPNVHVSLDGMIPMGACHHQKIAVIDDETVYWGGMDVALGRWDFRAHHVKNKHRADPAGLPHPNRIEHFSPYHDIQAVMSGPAGDAMVRLVRERWSKASSVEPLPIRPRLSDALPPTWPDSDPPDFENVQMAIARTVPAMHGEPQIEEIRQAYLDEIAQAENFIYIENQFLSCDLIAKAINKRLHERPQLRVLAVSCFDPQGVMEKKAMWGGRVRFRDLIEAGGVGDRVALSYPSCTENGRTDVVRIHSKLMIVDDRWLHLGSANINDRSMGMDTECDITLAGTHEAARAKIAAVRTDLIREHCGRPAEDIEQIIQSGGDVSVFLEDYPGSTQHLNRINDEQYRDEKFLGIAKFFADPRRPFLSSRWTVQFHHGRNRAQLTRSMIALTLLFLAFGLLAALWKSTPLADYVTVEALSDLFAQAKNSPLAIFWVTAIYVIGGLLFVPVTAMSAAVVIVFGGIKGLGISLVAATVSGIVGYYAGRLIGLERLKKISSHTEHALEKIQHTNVIGVAVVRTLPIAPFSAINLAFGVSRVSLLTFILGTIMGLLPGKITLALVGDSLAAVVRNPDAKSVTYALGGLAAWVIVMFSCNWLAKRWQSHHAAKQA